MNTLTESGIQTGQVIQASHILQLTNALRGDEAYKITPSGSWGLTGSFETKGYIKIVPTQSGSSFIPFEIRNEQNTDYWLKVDGDTNFYYRHNLSNYNAGTFVVNSNSNQIKAHYSNGELHYDSHLGSAGETIKHTSGRWDLPNTVTINKPNFDANTLVNIKAQSSSGLNVAVGIRSFTDTFYLHQTLANGEFKNQTTAGYIFDWWDYGNNFPALTMEAPNGGQLQQRFRYNGVNKASFALNSSGNKFNMNTQDNVLFEMRHVIDFVSNNVHVQKTVDGEWLFTNDPTSLQTPETGVRAKFYGAVKMVSPSSSSLDTAFSIRNTTDSSDIFKVLGNTQFGVNNTNVNSQFHIENNDFAWGFSVFQNKAFEDAIYISSTSGRAGYFISDSSVGIQGVNVTGANYGVVALGKNDGTGKALRASGEVKFISPSVSSLDTAFGVRNFADTAWYLQGLGSGTFIFKPDTTQQADAIQATTDGTFADKYPGLFTNNCIAAGAKPAIRAVSQGAGASSENYGILAIAQNGLAVNTGLRGQGFGATSILGIGVHGSTESGWGAGGYFTAPSGNNEAFATITTTKNLHKKFTNGTGLPAVNNMDGQFGAGVMAGVIVVESTTGLTIAISNGTNWIDIRTGVAVVI